MHSNATVLCYFGRSGSGDDSRVAKFPDNEVAKLMTDHVPASLHFSSLLYMLSLCAILDSISGSVAWTSYTGAWVASLWIPHGS